MDCDSGRAFHFSWVLAMPRDPERSRAPPPKVLALSRAEDR